ncbi:sugar ABC transporter substrate-binding protein [Microbacterium sp. p3-SID131]|uniref:sugar ABC transporter substrate-binding protein n=1 Tax=Microbacterium sp. p3-SID131 TaxID=2916215 RepID=UPI0021A81DEF|nr:sugar ABC transporter substrate-binding protein [Microbacterium sp. p3-SID131]MCT1365752.1 sugar ABC transporter substrate-binding protein [Microbacterium sp. p3-SID131]
MTKRVLATISVVSLSALALTGCGADDSGSEASKEVTVWMYPVIPDEERSAEFWSGVEKDFEAAHKGIDLTIELQPWDNRDEKIATAIASGTGPDLVLLGADQALNYVEIGGLKPVTDDIDDIDNFLASPLDAVTFDGDVYGVPIYQTATTVAYNKALFEAAGVDELPATWSEVLAAAPMLAEQGVAIFDYSGSPELTLNLSFYPLLWQAGGSVFTEDGTDIAFDGKEGVAALQFLLDLQAVGGLPTDAATKNNAVEGGPLALGSAAMGSVLTQPQVAQMQAALGEDAVVVGAPLKGREQVAYGTPGVLSLTTVSKDDAAALTAANFIASPAVAHELNIQAGNYPVRKDVEEPADDETTLAFVDALSFASPGEIFPNARQVMAVLAPHIQAALQGSVSAEQALADAAAEARTILGK